MKISSVNNISFQRNIHCIDAHTHDKPFELLGKDANSRALTNLVGRKIESNGDTFVVEKVFPSSLDCCFYKNGKPYLDEIKGNKGIVKAFEGTSINNFLAVCQPKDGNVKNIEKLFEEYPNSFVGLKFHPNGMELPADSKLYDSYLDFAQRHNLPCMFHSDRSVDTTYKWIENGIEQSSVVKKSEFSRPEQIYTLAKRHPKVPVVMAHMGGNEEKDIDAALDVILESAKNNDAKIYADISWVGIDDYKDGKRGMEKIVEIIKRLKNSESGDLTDRIMFGTDAPIDRFAGNDADKIYSDYISDINIAIRDNFKEDADEIIDKIFYKNADDLFFKKTWAKNLEQETQDVVEQTEKTLSKTKIGTIVGLGTLAFLGGIYFFKKSKNKEKTQVANAPSDAQNPQQMNLKNNMPDVFKKNFGSI